MINSSWTQHTTRLSWRNYDEFLQNKASVTIVQVLYILSLSSNRILISCCCNHLSGRRNYIIFDDKKEFSLLIDKQHCNIKWKKSGRIWFIWGACKILNWKQTVVKINRRKETSIVWGTWVLSCQMSINNMAKHSIKKVFGKGSIICLFVTSLTFVFNQKS